MGGGNQSYARERVLGGHISTELFYRCCAAVFYYRYAVVSNAVVSCVVVSYVIVMSACFPKIYFGFILGFIFGFIFDFISGFTAIISAFRYFCAGLTISGKLKRSSSVLPGTISFAS